MVNSLLIGIIILLFVMDTVIACVMYWLYRNYAELQKKCLSLEKHIERSDNDLAGICTAAIEVDTRLHLLDARLNDLKEKFYEIEIHAQGHVDTQSYQSAIERIHQGAGADELVKDCGLTRDEADLLVRLNGARKS